MRKISHEERLLYKYKWEFMRRSKEYKDAYAQAMSIFAQLGINGLDDDTGMVEALKDASAEAQLQKENDILSKFPLSSWIDPEITGDEMLKSNKLFTSLLVGQFRDRPAGRVRPMTPDIEFNLDYGFCKDCFHKQPLLRKYLAAGRLLEDYDGEGFTVPRLPLGVLALWIDLRNIGSYEDLRSRVMDVVRAELDQCKKIYDQMEDAREQFPGAKEVMIDGALVSIHDEHNLTTFKGKRKSFELFDMVLAVGDMHYQKGEKYEYITSLLTPEDYSVKPTATVRNMNEYGKTYERLVNGGWRALTYP